MIIEMLSSQGFVFEALLWLDVLTEVVQAAFPNLLEMMKKEEDAK